MNWLSERVVARLMVTPTEEGWNYWRRCARDDGRTKEKKVMGAGLPRFGWRTTPPGASLREVHPRRPVRGTLEDDG